MINQEQKITLHFFDIKNDTCISVGIPLLKVFTIDTLYYGIHNEVVVQEFKDLSNFILKEDENVLCLSEMVSGKPFYKELLNKSLSKEENLDKIKQTIELFVHNSKLYNREVFMDYALATAALLHTLKTYNKWTYISLSKRDI